MISCSDGASLARGPHVTPMVTRVAQQQPSVVDIPWQVLCEQERANEDILFQLLEKVGLYASRLHGLTRTYS